MSVSRDPMGKFGHTTVTSAATTAAANKFGVLYALEEATLTANCVGDDEVSGADTSISLTLPPGQAIFGTFDTLAVSAGTVIAYFVK